jgi:hypothetical protein
MKNFFTGQGISSDFDTLSFDQTVQLDPNDLVYHVHRIFHKSTTGAPIKETNFAEVPIQGNEGELGFLGQLGLTMDSSDEAKKLISPLAGIFYFGNLLFASDTPTRLAAMTVPERIDFLKPFLNLIQVVLEARMQWIHTISSAIPDTLELHTRAAAEIRAMEAVSKQFLLDY